MDEAGVLCAWWGPRVPLISNDAVAAIIARYPGRFAGVAAVGLARPMDAVRELRRRVRDLGFRALRVVPGLWNLPPSDRRPGLPRGAAPASPGVRPRPPQGCVAPEAP